jgi:DNA-binding NtrC family response regulator
MAGTGTVFLDEIGDTSPALQSKLLRILDDREFYPVGGERPLRTEARILAATHQPLERKVETGEFREDLYYRLRVVEVVVPPLRERPGDIPLLTRHLLERIAKKLHANVPAISHGALEALSAYKWPGNVRELENALTRAAVLAPGGTILEQHLLLGGPPTHGEPVRPIEDTLAAAEAAHAARILEREGWNKRRTARILGISRSRLDRLIVRHGLTPPGRHPGS